MWGQFELFISTHDIVLSDEVYKLLNSKGNSIFSAIQRQFSAKRRFTRFHSITRKILQRKTRLLI